MTTTADVLEFHPPPSSRTPEEETELLERRLARTEAANADLRQQRDDALRIVLACRKVIDSRDVMIAKLVASLIEKEARIVFVEGAWDMAVRALDRASQALRGAL